MFVQPTFEQKLVTCCYQKNLARNHYSAKSFNKNLLTALALVMKENNFPILSKKMKSCVGGNNG